MIPKVQSWVVRIRDTRTNVVVEQVIVEAPNKRFARWNSGLYLAVGQKFTVSPIGQEQAVEANIFDG